MGFDDNEQVPTLLFVVALGGTVKYLFYRLGLWLRERQETQALNAKTE